jgi:PAS domain S-box-containing protein
MGLFLGLPLDVVAMWRYAMSSRLDLLISTLLIIVAVLLGYLGLIIWRHRRKPGIRYLFWIMLSGLIWSSCYLLEIRSVGFAAKLFWAKVKYIGIVTIPVCWFLFVTEYVGYRYNLWPYSDHALFILPAIMLLIIATNPWHQMFFRPIDLQPYGDLSHLEVEYRFFFWLHTAYANLMLVVSFLALFHALIRTHRFYRMQILIMIAAGMFPWIGNASYLAGITPRVLRDPTPFAFLLTAILVALGTMRFRWLDLVPVARVIVLETMRDGVIVVDNEQRILDLNPAAVTMVGMPTQAILGKPVAAVLSRWQEIAEDALWSGEKSAHLAVETETSDRIYEVHISSLDSEEARNRQAGHILMFHDVTDHVQALREREQLIQDLDAFAHMVAHDIKNPVGTIVTAANLLYNEYATLPPEDVKMLAKVCRRAGNKVDNIINNLLVLAGVQKMQSLSLRPLDMDAIITEALLQLQDPIVHTGTHVNQPATWPTALGHAPWVEQVWVNYISNAIKYGGTPPEVTLGADPVTDSTTIRFWVRDNGAGLDDDEVKRIFEPFTRLDQVKVTGHGVGLSIVKRIVERLGGEVGVDCEEGEGCQFYFTLPVAEELSEAPGVQ